MLIDDFLAGGTTADAMFRLARMAGAKVVGAGFLIEKLNDAGRAYLSGYQTPIESLTVVDIRDGQIEVLDNAVGGDEAAAAQAELEMLLDANGRIAVDFTVGREADGGGEADGDGEAAPEGGARGGGASPPRGADEMEGEWDIGALG